MATYHCIKRSSNGNEFRSTLKPVERDLTNDHEIKVIEFVTLNGSPFVVGKKYDVNLTTVEK